MVSFNEDYEQGEQELLRLFARDVLRCMVARAEGTEFQNEPAGAWAERKLPWERVNDQNPPAAGLEVINVIKDAGTAGTFDIEIRAKTGGTGLDVVFSETAQTWPYHKEFSPPRRVLSEESGATDRGKLVIAIKPNGGTFTGKARVYGRPLR